MQQAMVQCSRIIFASFNEMSRINPLFTLICTRTSHFCFHATWLFHVLPRQSILHRSFAPAIQTRKKPMCSDCKKKCSRNCYVAHQT